MSSENTKTAIFQNINKTLSSTNLTNASKVYSFSDIFEININSNKLMQILNKFQENFNNITNQLSEMDNQIKQNHYNLNAKIINVDNNVRNYIRDQLVSAKNQLQSQIQGKSKENNRILDIKQGQIMRLRQQIQRLNMKINDIHVNFQQQMSKSMKNYSTQIWILKRKIQDTQQKRQQITKSFNLKIDKSQQRLQKYKQIIIQMANQNRFNFEQIFKNSGNPNIINCPQKKFQDSINTEKYAKFLQQNQDQQKYHKKTKSGPNQENYLTTIQYASIAEKVNILQKKIEQGKNSPTPYQMYPQQYQSSEQKQKHKRSFSNDIFGQIISKNSQSLKNIDQIDQKLVINQKRKSFDDQQRGAHIAHKIINKLQNIHYLMQTKQKDLKKNIIQLQQRFIINDEKIQFAKQKMSKVINEIGEIKVKIFLMQKKATESYQTSSIPAINQQLGKIIQRMDNEFAKRLDYNTYKQDQQKIKELLNQTHNYVKYKAEKQDVKKAINFLQDKIKQIILVIANQFNEQKNGAINKIQTKCLTCDKQIYKPDINNTSYRSNSNKGVQRLRTAKQMSQRYNSRILKPKKDKQNVKFVKYNTQLTNLSQEDQQSKFFKQFNN